MDYIRFRNFVLVVFKIAALDLHFVFILWNVSNIRPGQIVGKTAIHFSLYVFAKISTKIQRVS